MKHSPVSRALSHVQTRHTRMNLAVLALRSLLGGWFLASLFRAFYTLGWSPPPWYLTSLVFLAMGTTIVWIGRKQPMSTLEAARITDRRLGLKDLLATSLEFADSDTPFSRRLQKDAEFQAQSIDPSQVLPLPKPWSFQIRQIALLGVAALTLWNVPIPSGLLIEGKRPSLTVTSETPEEKHLRQQMLALMDRLAKDDSVQARRIARDLDDLQRGLREREISHDEAVALLRHFQRRADALKDRENDFQTADELLDIERIQQLAERVQQVTLPRQSLVSQLAPAFQAREATEGTEPLPSDLERVLQQISEREGESQHSDARADRQSQGGADLDPQDFDEAPSMGFPSSGQTSEEDESASKEDGSALDSDSLAGAAGDPGRADSGFEADPTPGSDERAGVGEGTGTDSTDDVGRQIEPSTLEHLPGMITAGPLHMGQVQAGPVEHGAEAPLEAGPVFETASPTEADAIDRERIPLEYREVIFRYFRDLEPDH